MKKEVTIVPKDKCPLDILAELKERTESAWIYMHENVIAKLAKDCDQFHEAHGCTSFAWIATKDFPTTKITLVVDVIGCWKPVFAIDAGDIAFKHTSSDPEEIFFLKMEE